MTYYRQYQDNSGKPALFLLHSGGMSSAEWAPQIPYLIKSFNVITPDLPGHGKTLLTNEASISTMANAVLAVMAKENLGKAHILGSSMGAATALWLAIKHPQVVDKLVLYRMGYEKHSETYQQTQNMADPKYWQSFGLHHWLSKLHEPQGNKDSWKTVIANVSKIMDPQNTEHHHSLADLATIQAKTLLIAGDRDPIAPIKTLLEMHHAIPDSGLWLMPYASHITASNTWRAKSFADEVIRFLK